MNVSAPSRPARSAETRPRGRLRRRPPQISDEPAAALRENGVTDWRNWRDGPHAFHLADVRDYHAMRPGCAICRQRRLAGADRPAVFEAADDYAGADDGLPFVWSLRDQIEAPKG